MGLFDKLFGKTSQVEPGMATKKVRQTIFGEVTEFDYSDFQGLIECQLKLSLKNFIPWP